MRGFSEELIDVGRTLSCSDSPSRAARRVGGCGSFAAVRVVTPNPASARPFPAS